jgi:hypothetical protein
LAYFNITRSGDHKHANEKTRLIGKKRNGMMSEVKNNHKKSSKKYFNACASANIPCPSVSVINEAISDDRIKNSLKLSKLNIDNDFDVSLLIDNDQELLSKHCNNTSNIIECLFRQIQSDSSEMKSDMNQVKKQLDSSSKKYSTDFYANVHTAKKYLNKSIIGKKNVWLYTILSNNPRIINSYLCGETISSNQQNANRKSFSSMVNSETIFFNGKSFPSFFSLSMVAR